jgi:hypothetical protein
VVHVTVRNLTRTFALLTRLLVAMTAVLAGGALKSGRRRRAYAHIVAILIIIIVILVVLIILTI